MYLGYALTIGEFVVHLHLENIIDIRTIVVESFTVYPVNDYCQMLYSRQLPVPQYTSGHVTRLTYANLRDVVPHVQY